MPVSGTGYASVGGVEAGGVLGEEAAGGGCAEGEGGGAESGAEEEAEGGHCGWLYLGLLIGLKVSWMDWCGEKVVEDGERWKGRKGRKG